MSHTYSSCFIHTVFSTKRRQRILSSTTRDRLWPFLDATARKNGFRIVAANGSDDHVHLLVTLRQQPALAVQRRLRLAARELHQVDREVEKRPGGDDVERARGQPVRD